LATIASPWRGDRSNNDMVQTMRPCPDSKATKRRLMPLALIIAWIGETVSGDRAEARRGQSRSELAQVREPFEGVDCRGAVAASDIVTSGQQLGARSRDGGHLVILGPLPRC
jgi:hypothetical protein